jgi:hypothetical protein
MAVGTASFISHTQLLSNILLYLSLVHIPFMPNANTLPRSCTCPGEDHPGPSVNVGRGAPEIDILEVEHNKVGSGQVVLQSGQFAPFTHDYVYLNDTQDEWFVNTPDITRANTHQGSAV